jgi:hypothetical protein
LETYFEWNRINKRLWNLENLKLGSRKAIVILMNGLEGLCDGGSTRWINYRHRPEDFEKVGIFCLQRLQYFTIKLDVLWDRDGILAWKCDKNVFPN